MPLFIEKYLILYWVSPECLLQELSRSCKRQKILALKNSLLGFSSACLRNKTCHDFSKPWEFQIYHDFLLDFYILLLVKCLFMKYYKLLLRKASQNKKMSISKKFQCSRPTLIFFITDLSQSWHNILSYLIQ